MIGISTERWCWWQCSILLSLDERLILVSLEDSIGKIFQILCKEIKKRSVVVEYSRQWWRKSVGWFWMCLFFGIVEGEILWGLRQSGSRLDT